MWLLGCESSEFDDIKKRKKKKTRDVHCESSLIANNTVHLPYNICNNHESHAEKNHTH